jgi:hypothetical protein
MIDDATRAKVREAMARAYDKEDAAQRGEADPWSFASDDDAAEEEWREERRACAEAALTAALPLIEEACRPKWQPIETAPKDGTPVDLMIDGRRHTDCYWGFPSHCCGEAGRYCDSEWHALTEGWVDGTFNEPIGDEDVTHWMTIPAPPSLSATDGV